MIAVPYLTFGSLGFYFYRLFKKQQRTLDSVATSCDSSQLTTGVEES